MAAVSIKNLKSYGNGWMWTETITSPHGDDHQVVHHCRTNARGEGLWLESNGEDRQVVGTCDYSLPSNRKPAYNKIRREALREHST